jgi:dTDP-4-amino-4,6-dideoxygalactose transaminase
MNENKFLPFAEPEIGEEEVSEVISLLKTGWLTTGPKAKQFEQEFSSFIGGGVESVAVNSATSGLHLGLEAFGIGNGDQVITTTHTFTATAEVIRYLGADPVFVDVDPKTLCIDITAVETAITSRTKAIIPVHFAGRSADMQSLIALARKHKIRILEDAAHALPTTCRGSMIGSLESDATVFSFYANKTITTGEGGMLVTRNPDIARRARLMRLHGINRDAFDRFISKKPSWFYEIVAPGFKYNMMDLSAAIGIHQLKKVKRFQEKRAEIARQYDDAFRNLPIELPPHADIGDIHSWHLYVIQLLGLSEVERDLFIQKMYDKGVGCSVHYIPLHMQPYWRDSYKLTPEMFPVSKKIYERSVSLPIYSKMNQIQIERVISAVKGALGS